MEDFTISKNTLKMMDEAVENLRKGEVSDPIDVSKYTANIIGKSKLSKKIKDLIKSTSGDEDLFE